MTDGVASSTQPQVVKPTSLCEATLSKPSGGQQTKKRKESVMPVTQSEGHAGLIDGNVALWTRKAPKVSETSLRPRTLAVLEGAEMHSLKQAERLKAVIAAVWLEAKVRGYGWTPNSGLKRGVSYDRKIASLAMNGANTIDNVRCILASFITWAEDNVDIIEGDCIEGPVKVDVITEFVADPRISGRVD